MTWNEPQWVRHNLQWPECTYNEQRKDAKQPTASSFADYFTIWGQWFSSLTRFPPNIWLQSFEHCFTENHGQNSVKHLLLCIKHQLSCVIFTGYTTFFCLGFMSAGKGRDYSFSSSLPLPPSSQIVWSLAIAFIGEVYNEWGLYKWNQEPYYIFLLSKPLINYCCKTPYH